MFERFLRLASSAALVLAFSLGSVRSREPQVQPHRRQSADEVRWSVKQLDHFNEAGKPVLVID